MYHKAQFGIPGVFAVPCPGSAPGRGRSGTEHGRAGAAGGFPSAPRGAPAAHRSPSLFHCPSPFLWFRVTISLRSVYTFCSQRHGFTSEFLKTLWFCVCSQFHSLTVPFTCSLHSLILGRSLWQILIIFYWL